MVFHEKQVTSSVCNSFPHFAQMFSVVITIIFHCAAMSTSPVITQNVKKMRTLGLRFNKIKDFQ